MVRGAAQFSAARARRPASERRHPACHVGCSQASAALDKSSQLALCLASCPARAQAATQVGRAPWRPPKEVVQRGCAPQRAACFPWWGRPRSSRIPSLPRFFSFEARLCTLRQKADKSVCSRIFSSLLSWLLFCDAVVVAFVSLLLDRRQLRGSGWLSRADSGAVSGSICADLVDCCVDSGAVS